jgi:triacylglycerol esterase/lipase EstA (alpha/beta hydrolase family)
MRHPSLRQKAALAAGMAAAAVMAATAASLPASAAPAHTTIAARAAQTGDLTVNWSFAAGFVSGFGSPTTSPPGANNFACKSAAHPIPVILVHGTFENMNDNWQGASPLLANHGYCVFAFNYGGGSATDSIQGTGDIPASAAQLAAFVSKVLAATGAPKADIVGHSQGGMMPRYYLKFLGGAAKVDKLIGLAPSSHGTGLDGLVNLGNVLGLLGPINSSLSTSCTACVQQETGSPFMAALNAGGDTVPGVTYTVIESTGDEVVTPYTSAFLSGPNVTNITVNNQCASDASDHLEIANDPIALADVLNALDPAHPVNVPCLTVLGLFGPVGPVPSF